MTSIKHLIDPQAPRSTFPITYAMLTKSEGDTHTFAPDPMFNPTDEQKVRFPLEDWKYEVANGDTEEGYHDWLESKLDEEAFDAQMKERVK